MSATTEPELPHRVIPYLAVRGGVAALEFYVAAFGAVEISRLTNEDGTLGHAEFAIGQARLFLADEWPQMRVLSPATLGGYSVSLAIEVAEVDAFVNRAVAAGARIERPVGPGPMPGSRAGWLIDPFGHRWHISSGPG